jgi:hypothetical protein
MSAFHTRSMGAPTRISISITRTRLSSFGPFARPMSALLFQVTLQLEQRTCSPLGERRDPALVQAHERHDIDVFQRSRPLR